MADNKEPGKWLSAFQALLIVLLFLFLLAWSLSWKPRPPQISPPLSIEIFEIIPIPKVTEPVKTKTVKTPKEKLKVVDAEIVIKKRKEEDLKKREEKKLKDKERKKREDDKRKKKEREDKERKEREKREDEDRKKREDEDRKKREDEDRKKREALLAAQKDKADADAATARAAHLENLQNIYKGRIIGRIQSHLTTPKSVPKDESIIVVVRLQLTPNGELVDLPEIEESSGYAEYDESALRAILRAAPLPMPKEPELIKDFQDMILYITP